MNKQRIKQLIGENATIVEIGSADGTDTRELMELGQVYAFEPEPKNVEILNNIGGLILFPFAVSDIDGFVTFNRSKNEKEPGALSLSGSIMKPKNHLKFWDWISFNEQIEVKSVRLDTMFNEMGTLIDFVWCDVQGAEEKVILGGLKTFKKVRYFYTEYSNDEQYEGQPTLERIMELLPDFEILLDYGGDVLLKNTKL